MMASVIAIPAQVLAFGEWVGWSLQWQQKQVENMLRYVTGLVVSGKGTLTAITNVFAARERKSVSAMSRFAQESPWEYEEFNL